MRTFLILKTHVFFSCGIPLIPGEVGVNSLKFALFQTQNLVMIPKIEKANFMSFIDKLVLDSQNSFQILLFGFYFTSHIVSLHFLRGDRPSQKWA